MSAPDRYVLDEIQYPATPFSLARHCVLLGKRGSEAHGTYIPPSEPDAIDDRDVLGVCIPPLDYYFGTRRWEGKTIDAACVEAINGCWDVVLYSLPKFLGLLLKQNPNVLAMLWLREEDYLRLGPVGAMLIEQRDLFRARHAAYDAFIGYARGQLKRMTAFQHQGYMGAKRKALADKYGYDCKNAAHLIRLLLMGIEFMRTGRLTVYRAQADRDVLMAIKRGAWSLTNVKIWADRLFGECEEAYAKSTVPEQIDRGAVNDLSMRMHREFFGGGPW